MSPATYAPGSHRVFVYGTLKRGMWNNRILREGKARFTGEVRTVREDFRLHLAEAGYPYLTTTSDGSGEAVDGELFEVNDGTLELLDELEEIASGMYSRETIEVRRFLDDAYFQAYFYLAGPRIDVSALERIHAYDQTLHDERYLPKDRPRMDQVDRW